MGFEPHAREEGKAWEGKKRGRGKSKTREEKKIKKDGAGSGEDGYGLSSEYLIGRSETKMVGVGGGRRGSILRAVDVNRWTGPTDGAVIPLDSPPLHRLVPQRVFDGHRREYWPRIMYMNYMCK